MAIYARLENGTYAEVTGVYKTDGTEVTEIFQGDRLVYSATNEIYGTVPLYYDGLGYELIDYLLSGNTVQDGTPTPDAPVDATGCGVRTGNLWSGGNVSIAVGDIYKHTPIDLPNNTYTFKAKYNSTNTGSVSIGFYDENDIIHVYSMNQIDGEVSASYTGIITAIRLYSAAGYNLSRSYSADFADIMLNLGSTALQYEPYGFKLPLTVNGTEYPIYLGHVETTRRVKKLVLTGEEDIAFRSGNAKWYIPIADLRVPDTASITWYCSHYQAVANNATWASYDYMISWSTADIGSSRGLRIRDINFLTGATLADFKSYLSAQYAAGTPVTVWYVLAEPETAAVNEPLMKIGGYADTISFAQAGVTIPTVSGANVLDMTSTVKPSEVYVKGKGIRPTGYGQLVDVNSVNILDKDGRPIYVHGR